MGGSRSERANVSRARPKRGEYSDTSIARLPHTSKYRASGAMGKGDQGQRRCRLNEKLGIQRPNGVASASHHPLEVLVKRLHCHVDKFQNSKLILAPMVDAVKARDVQASGRDIERGGEGVSIAAISRSIVPNTECCCPSYLYSRDTVAVTGTLPRRCPRLR